MFMTTDARVRFSWVTKHGCHAWLRPWRCSGARSDPGFGKQIVSKQRGDIRVPAGSRVSPADGSPVREDYRSSRCEDDRSSGMCR